ncbi:GntR family transcriptional regulator [Oenococcus oeni]|uniref:GntR family transcriptional regulator n=1 Tax=Oenococcus oeni TaxID=1247 RepID=UPI0008F8B32D|nr:GntR family transcriptional regulator [Oenococcus oeni]OIL24207.1 GntR family transcriptional regulator [Oenococcus oeni]OIL32750.1 GntR family transcriptional regulator [Oenococcus oeni]
MPANKAKYKIIKQQIKNNILSARYKIGDRLPTESDFMAEFDVSRFTIRRAIDELVNENFVRRVQGNGMYIKDWHKVNKADEDLRTIAVITTHVADYIFPNIINAIDEVISDAEYSLILANTHNDPKRERDNLLRLLKLKPSAWIIEPTQSAVNRENLDLYQQIKKLDVPAVFINSSYPGIGFLCLKTDDRGSLFELTNYLFSIGHRRIIGVFQIDDIRGVERMKGFADAYLGHPYFSDRQTTIMYKSTDDYDKIFTRITNFYKNQTVDKPDAIICYNDQLAIALIDNLKEQGWKIPEDISIIGFDDYNISRYITPTLTTLSHPKSQMGRDAGKMILNLIDNKAVKSITYYPELVLRKSVMPI